MQKATESKNIVTSMRLPQPTRTQIDALAAAWNVSIANVVTIAIDRMYQQEIKTMQPRNITESWLQSWIDAHRPDLGLYEVNGVKGFYKLDAGLASSFIGIGKTWRQVAAHLEAIEVSDAA